MPLTQVAKALPQIFRPLGLFVFWTILVVVYAQDSSQNETQALQCVTDADTFVGNSQARFKMTHWMDRGICIRAEGRSPICYQTLLAALSNLNELRRAEYSGSAGVLALLPTIGALLGAPTNEVWTLLTILPFGGILAMALSFGGAIMPVRIEDYEHAMKKRNIAIGSIVSFRMITGDSDISIQQKLDQLEEKVSTRIACAKRMRPSNGFLSLGLLGMILLFIGSQAAVTVLEQCGIIPWWCTSRWWMHLWYFMVTVTAITENFVQLPFIEQHKLYVSRVPYNISLSGGESIFTNNLQQRRGSEDLELALKRTVTEHENVGLALTQLHTMPAAKVTFHDSMEHTIPRNSVLVMVSVTGNAKSSGSFWRLISKSVSIAVFITGTALFASVTLVSLPMAVMALTLVLSAGVFGRAIAGWMVRTVAEQEPIIHVIVNNTEDANKAIRSILKLKLDTEPVTADVQVEIHGHVFVNGRRVAKRSRWYVAVLGVLAKPYDLGRVREPFGHGSVGSNSTGLLPGEVSTAGHNSPAAN
ncbi:hypothetical protein CKM354_000932300 [Cercospora kikuchii]|uniref:Uncharacterized protein n=1 Tax=Cercospora kikuchii TaxID=84275 RepID=A0A9P3FK92_9PEZI|nr:uncharacterized protein CKM354_000932300 [Cercospora kikuchii]GIZ46185.1 hypothetical protein CKM354_000932300 [Cercospora kikuchii]